MYNIYSELNKIIDYIENHILEEIDIKLLSKSIGMNTNTLKSIFNYLTGVTINEYIRLRRLSLAVTDILNGESITNISYKYLYNSPSSFNRAFKKFEGITPRELKNSSNQLKLFNRITFIENTINPDINYRIYKDKEFDLYYISKNINYNNRQKEIPEFWMNIKEEYPEFSNNIRYGFLNKKDEKYYCLLEKKFKNSKKITIKKCKYFAIKTKEFNSENIITNINKGIKEYIKALNYELLDLPRIEVYYNDYVEILIPIT